MPIANPPRRHGKTAGTLLLFGWFLLLCAGLSFLDAGWRAWHARSQGRWIKTPAQIQKCLLDVYYPFVKDGGGIVYSLRCRLSYEFAGLQRQYDLHTRSERSTRSRTNIENWIRQNRAGAVLLTRVNPSNPNELVVDSDLPQRQFGTTAEALTGTAAFGLPAFLLIAIGRRLTFR